MNPGNAEVVAPYITSTHALGQLLLSLPEQPLAVGVGEFKAAAVLVEVRLMSPDLRSGWYDRHVDEGAVSVVVLRETSRAARVVVGVDLASGADKSVTVLSGLERVIAEGGKLLDRTECPCGSQQLCRHGLCWQCDDCPCMDEGAEA